MNIKEIKINKNRGWRGLAEVVALNDEGKREMRMVFSFSQPMWDKLLLGYIVLQDVKSYYVVEFGNLEDLPKPSQQRSVLIKNFKGKVVRVSEYVKDDEGWTQEARLNGHYDIVNNFIKNRNNHTTSDWNCIGIRVTPSI